MSMTTMQVLGTINMNTPPSTPKRKRALSAFEPSPKKPPTRFKKDDGNDEDEFFMVDSQGASGSGVNKVQS